MNISRFFLTLPISLFPFLSIATLSLPLPASLFFSPSFVLSSIIMSRRENVLHVMMAVILSLSPPILFYSLSLPSLFSLSHFFPYLPFPLSLSHSPPFCLSLGLFLSLCLFLCLTQSLSLSPFLSFSLPPSLSLSPFLSFALSLSVFFSVSRSLSHSLSFPFTPQTGPITPWIC